MYKGIPTSLEQGVQEMGRLRCADPGKSAIYPFYLILLPAILDFSNIPVPAR